MNLAELAQKNRSYRGFAQNPRLTDAQLEQLVALTRHCASSMNLQPLKYFISNDEKNNALIQRHTLWARRLGQIHLPHPGCEPTSFVLILHDLTIAPNAAAFAMDVGIAANIILLGAAETGFGGCMIGSFSAPAISQALALPEHLKLMLVVALGKPNETVVLHEAPSDFIDQNHYYARDENDVHHVWKRPLQDILIKG